MTSEEVKELIHAIESSSFKYFELSQGDFSIKMSKREIDTAYVSSVDTMVQTNSKVYSMGDSDQVQSTPLPESSRDNRVEDAGKDEDEADLHVVHAPIVGTSYLSSSPETPAFVKPGDRITTGQTLFIIEAMKVMNEIKSDVDGIVKEILVEDGQAVEFNQALIKIDTE